MTDYKVIHERNRCIGCGACITECDEHWQWNKDDRKTFLKKSKRNGDGSSELIIDKKDDFKCLMRAAEGCPINIIHITDLDTNEQLI